MSRCTDRRLSTGEDKLLGREGGARSGGLLVGSAIPSDVSRVRWTLRSAPLIALRAGAAGEDQTGTHSPQGAAPNPVRDMVPQHSCQRFLVLRVFSPWKRKHSKRLAPQGVRWLGMLADSKNPATKNGTPRRSGIASSLYGINVA